MPELSFQVSEFDASVIDRVAAQVVQAMLHDLTLNTLFNDNNLTIRSDRMEDANSSDGEGGVRLSSSDRCDILVSEVTNPAKLRWDIINFSNTQAYGQSSRDRLDMLPLLRDHSADITVWEYNKPCNIRLDFSLKFRDKAEAMRVESVITTRYHGSSVHNPHDISYAYPIGLDLAAALFVLYKLRASYNINHEFVTYLREFSTQAVVFEVSKPVADATAERRLMLKRVNLQALGLLEYDQEKPSPVTIQKVTDRWELQFSYTLQFSRPDTFRLCFPSVVENEWVPAAVLPATEPDGHLFLRQMEGLLRQTSFNHALRRFNKRPEVLVRLPYYDQFYPRANGPTMAHGYKPVLIAAFVLDEGGTTIDLNELGEVALDPTVLEIIGRHTGGDIFKTVGLFNISVYSNEVLMNPSRLSISEDLVIAIDATAVSQRYHLVLSETTEISQINDTYLTLLMEYRWFFALLVARNIRTLIRSGYFRSIPSPEALELIDRLFKSGGLEVYLSEMVEEGHATVYLFRVATGAYQLLEYLLVTISPVAKTFLYDVLIAKLLEDNVISEAPRAPGIRTHNGLPIHQLMKAEGHGYSTPLRVNFTRIATQ